MNDTHKRLVKRCMAYLSDLLKEDLDSEHPLPSSINVCEHEGHKWVRVSLNMSQMRTLTDKELAEWKSDGDGR